MQREISFYSDRHGKHLSGIWSVFAGRITVTAPDGRQETTHLGSSERRTNRGTAAAEREGAHIKLLDGAAPIVRSAAIKSTASISVTAPRGKPVLRDPAQEAVGKATSVRPQAEGTHGGTRTLSGGADVYSRETVRTGDSGQADLQFHDKSNLSVGPKSSVRLDKFVYDTNKSTGTVAIQATRGTFRFVTGSQGGSYQIKSPYGTLGIRG